MHSRCFPISWKQSKSGLCMMFLDRYSTPFFPSHKTDQSKKKLEAQVPFVGGDDTSDSVRFRATIPWHFQSPIVKKCRYIQNTVLQKCDPQLHQFLQKMNIEPQLYMLRWVRLLLGREFHLDDLLILWDAIFSYSTDLQLVDYICAAMLMYIRSQCMFAFFDLWFHRNSVGQRLYKLFTKTIQVSASGGRLHICREGPYSHIPTCWSSSRSQTRDCKIDTQGWSHWFRILNRSSNP